MHGTGSTQRVLPFFLWPALLAVAVLAAPAAAEAQIKRPGAAPRYDVELEPHLLMQWANRAWGRNGLGIGGRASIPVIANGPIKTINNNFAVGFGLDWAHFSGCNWGWRRGAWWDRRLDPRWADCRANNIWLPAVAQWNFFLTERISVFPELGLGIQHIWWRFCDPGGFCDRFSDTRLDLMFFAGGRFLITDSVGITVRLGTPYISAGVSILL